MTDVSKGKLQNKNPNLKFENNSSTENQSFEGGQYDQDIIMDNQDQDQQNWQNNEQINLQDSIIQKTVEVQKRILAKTKTEKTNYLSFNNKFETVGSNGIFGASPSIVKFAGFELKKTHTLKVKLINQSAAPQRLHILPPTTPFFKIKYNKKGMVPTGVSEDIYVQFTPGSDYKYFYDSIRIHCEGDKILIPIHAYPVINSKESRLLPERVDMGQGCIIGQTYSQQISIKSICSVNFEFEIKAIKDHPDIQVNPIIGDIMGLEQTPINIYYRPSTFTTAEAEYELRTSEFDFKPQLVKIIGSSQPSKTKVKQLTNSQDFSQEITQNKTLLTNKSNRGYSGKRQAQGAQLEKIPESAFKKSSKAVVKQEDKPQEKQENKTQQKSSSPKKSMKLSEQEQVFLKEYARLENFEREKGIKFFECIGDAPMTQEYQNIVDSARWNFIENKKTTMRRSDRQRYATELNSDKVVVPTNLEITLQPKWDVYQNSHFSMRKRLVGIFLRAANKLIIRMRAEKRKKLITNLLKQNQISTRESMKKFVLEDWKNALSSQGLGGSEDETDISNVRFHFRFNRKFLKPEIKLPLEFEGNVTSFIEKIDAQPIISFDDLEQFDPIEKLDFEVEKYSPFPQLPFSRYEPVFADKGMRPGCQYESSLRPRAGEPDLEKIQLKAHDQMELLKKKTKENVSGANVPMPVTFQKPLEHPVELLLRPHPTVRVYQRQGELTEIDPAYHLYPAVRQRIEPKDEIELRNSKQQNDIELIKSLNKSVSGHIVNQTQVPTHEMPGKFGFRLIESMPDNIRDVHIDQKQNMDLGGKCDYRLVKIPEILKKPDTNDYLTDEESDEANDFELKVPELDDLLSKFENDDDVLGKEKQSLQEFVKDQRARGFEPEARHDIKNAKGEKIKMLNENIKKQRELQTSVISGHLQDINEVVKLRANKLFLA